MDVIVLDRASPLIAREAVRGIPLLARDEHATLEWTLEVDRETEDWGAVRASFLDERAQPCQGWWVVTVRPAQARSARTRVGASRPWFADVAKHRGLDWATYRGDVTRRR